MSALVDVLLGWVVCEEAASLLLLLNTQPFLRQIYLICLRLFRCQNSLTTLSEHGNLFAVL
jgi:hypothetical protein